MDAKTHLTMGPSPRIHRCGILVQEMAALCTRYRFSSYFSSMGGGFALMDLAFEASMGPVGDPTWVALKPCLSPLYPCHAHDHTSLVPSVGS